MRKIWFAAAMISALGACRGGEENGANQASSNAAAPPAAAGPAAGAKRFVNNPNNNFSAGMKEKYVDFTFDYPAGWEEKIDPSEQNFVQVAPRPVNEVPPLVFAVGNASAEGPPAQRRQLLQSLLPQFEQQFGSSFQDFQVVWRGERKIGRYDTLGIGFTGKMPGKGEMLNAAGRIDIIVPPDQDRGVTLISMALSPDEAPEPAQFAEMPGFRTIYDSLQVGAPAR